MAPVDFEKQMREKLQERELTPNPETWSKLEQQLALQEKPTRTLIRPWAVAAAVITIVLLSVWWLRPTAEVATPLVTNPEVQEEAPLFEKEILQTPDSDIASESVVEKKQAEIKTTPSEEIATTNTMSTTASEEKQSQIMLSPEAKEAIASAVEVPKETPLITESIAQNVTFEEQKIDEIVTQVKLLQQQNKTVTTAEIETLMAAAQQEIKSNQLFKEGGFEVDATALLQEVETELERSFRDKVFDALGKGFEKIRTAVAERNQ